jgi:MFS family permease
MGGVTQNSNIISSLDLNEASHLNAKSRKGRKRPFGVTVLALLQTVSGIQLLIEGLVFLALATIATSPEVQDAVSSFADENLARSLPAILTIFGLVFLALAILSFHLARGYLNGHEWARRRGRKVAVFAILIAVLSMILMTATANPSGPIWTILFNLFILGYLGRKRIRTYFR